MRQIHLFSKECAQKHGETAQRVKEESCKKLQVDKHYPFFEDISSNDKSLQQFIDSPIDLTDSNTCNNTLMDFGGGETSHIFY